MAAGGEDSPVTIRRSADGDTEGFWRCLDAVARERRWLAFLEAPPLEDTKAFLAAMAPIQMVAVEDDRVVGWCDVTPSPREGFRHSGTLGMGLLPELRGRGLGSRLLAATLEAARAAGLSRIELEVLASNDAAVALYERHGFRHEGRKRAARILDGRVEDLLCMARLETGDGPSSTG
jgi:ribosomal protein S18 acetylase RimI-like enzyme